MEFNDLENCLKSTTTENGQRDLAKQDQEVLEDFSGWSKHLRAKRFSTKDNNRLKSVNEYLEKQRRSYSYLIKRALKIDIKTTKFPNYNLTNVKMTFLKSFWQL